MFEVVASGGDGKTRQALSRKRFRSRYEGGSNVSTVNPASAWGNGRRMRGARRCFGNGGTNRDSNRANVASAMLVGRGGFVEVRCLGIGRDAAHSRGCTQRTKSVSRDCRGFGREGTRGSSWRKGRFGGSCSARSPWERGGFGDRARWARRDKCTYVATYARRPAHLRMAGPLPAIRRTEADTTEGLWKLSAPPPPGLERFASGRAGRLTALGQRSESRMRTREVQALEARRRQRRSDAGKPATCSVRNLRKQATSGFDHRILFWG